MNSFSYVWQYIPQNLRTNTLWGPDVKKPKKVVLDDLKIMGTKD